MVTDYPLPPDEDPVLPGLSLTKRRLAYLSLTLDEISRRYREGHLLEVLFIQHRLSYVEAVAYYYVLKAMHPPAGGKPPIFNGITSIARAVGKLAKQDQQKPYQRGFIPTTTAKLFPIVKRLIETGLFVKETTEGISHKRTWKSVAYVPRDTIEDENLGLRAEQRVPFLAAALLSQFQPAEDYEKQLRQRAQMDEEELRRRCHVGLTQLDFTHFPDVLTLFSEEQLRRHLRERKKDGGNHHETKGKPKAQ